MYNKLDLMLNYCLELKKLSKCKDKKTAAVLTNEDMTQIYSIGINGGPKGGQNCLCSHGDGKQKYTCVHAEMNCLVKNKVHDSTEKILICSKQPCAMCASLIVNSDNNIKAVYYDEEYWDNTGIDILVNAGVIVKQFEYNKEEL